MTSDEDTAARQLYAVVGELVLIASAVDHQLNQICIALLGLENSPMQEAVLATIDARQKVEIIKARSKLIGEKGWKRALLEHAKSVEKINTSRNIAAHGIMSFKERRPVLSPPAAAKLLKAIDLSSGTAKKTETSELESAIRLAERTLGSGATLLDRLKLVAAERDRRMKSRRNA